MENPILNCLMANIFGTGNQILPQGGANVPVEGENAFLALFSQKMMNGIFGAALPETVSNVSEDAAPAEGKETTGLSGEVDCSGVSLLVSALAASLEQPAASQSQEKDMTAFIGFLHNILDILSDGDEIEVQSAAENGAGNGTGKTALKEDAGQKGLDNAAANSFAGSLAVLLAALNRMARQNTGEAQALPVKASIPDPGQVKGDPPPQRGNVPDALKAVAPDPGAIPASTGEVKGETTEGPAFLVQVTRSIKDNEIVDVSMKDLQKKPAFSVPVMPDEKKAENLPGSQDSAAKEKIEVDRVIIRVADKDDPDTRNNTGDRPANENGMGLQGNARPDTQHKPEVHAAAKNDFSTMMIDKIEKITEQYAGKNLGMDMTVKLKINDNETILVGLRDEGTRVTVEVKTANENTLNFIQSQKSDLVKSLEDKHIMTTIHVDIDQDAQNRREQEKRRENGRDDAEETRDFGNFFEALA
jgi:hypothetical protein